MIIGKIATGEETDPLPEDDRKDPAAKAVGQKGDKRMAVAMICCSRLNRLQVLASSLLCWATLRVRSSARLLYARGELSKVVGMKMIESIIEAMGILAVWTTLSFWLYIPKIIFYDGLNSLWGEHLSMTVFTVAFTCAGVAGAIFAKRKR